MVNTGYKKYNTLLKVVDGGPFDGQPLDINNNLVSISGLPQETKENDSEDSDYVPPVLDTVFCPIFIPFTFTPETGATINTLYNSEEVLLEESFIDYVISVTLGEYRINGGTWTTEEGVISSGDTLEVRGTSSSDYLTAIDVATIIVGDYTTSFNVETEEDNTPAPVSFTPVIDAELATLYESNTITITGL